MRVRLNMNKQQMAGASPKEVRRSCPLAAFATLASFAACKKARSPTRRTLAHRTPQHPTLFPRVVGPDRASGDLVTGSLDGALYLMLFGPAARKRYRDHAGRRVCLGLRDVLQPLHNFLEAFEGRGV